MKIGLPFFFSLLLACCLSSCTYLKYASVQAEYERIQNAEPGQINLKHMIDRDTFFVLGMLKDIENRYSNYDLGVAAYSDMFKPHERVDTMYSANAQTHYGLNLPSGEYTLLVFADINHNRLYESSEIVGSKEIAIHEQALPYKVLEGVDISLTSPSNLDWIVPVELPDIHKPKESLFYPSGTIRSMDDPLFSETFATIGMYDPASFLEQATTMFYTLEEETPYKIPVVFVHGIGGTVRSFRKFVDNLDRKRYKPWFFYYPSGGDLDQLADFFYRIFLSGRVINTGEMPMIVVAHSMGGLIVREALNRYSGLEKENNLRQLFTIATPFGGHPAAASGEKYGSIVLPSWKDVNPENEFIKKLYRKPLPETVDHYLLYAFHNPSTLKLQENSDGVVPLSSQLSPAAQKESRKQFGFNSGHSEILENDELISYVMEHINSVRNIFPQSHLKILYAGGFDYDLAGQYSPIFSYMIETIGRYMVAMAKGELQPFAPEQEHFVGVSQKTREPETVIEKEWLRFLSEHPEILD